MNPPLGQGHVPPAPVAPLVSAVAGGGGGGGGVPSDAEGQVKLSGALQGDLGGFSQNLHFSSIFTL